jgi:hypothetical protein
MRIRTELTGHNGRYLNKAVPPPVEPPVSDPGDQLLFLVTLLARSTQSPWVRAVLCWALNPKPRTTPQPADRSHSHRQDNLADAEIWLRIVAHLLEWRPLGPQKSTGPRVRAVNCIAAAHVNQPYRLCVGKATSKIRRWC